MVLFVPTFFHVLVVAFVGISSIRNGKETNKHNENHFKKKMLYECNVQKQNKYKGNLKHFKNSKV